MTWYQKPTKVECFGIDVDVALDVDLHQVRPWVKDSFAFHLAFLRARLPGKQVVITSGWRDDGGIHNEGRALDYIVEGMMGDPKTCQVLSELAGLCHIFFPYGSGYDGSWHWAYLWRTDDRHYNHIHWQGPPYHDGEATWPRLL